MNRNGSPEGLLKGDLRREIERSRVVVVGSGVSVADTENNPVASWAGLLEDGVSRCEQLFLPSPFTSMATGEKGGCPAGGG